MKKPPNLIIETAIVIIGEICSGKSTLAKKVAAQNQFPLVSFGSYVKNLCIEKEIEPTRKNMQELGEKMVSENPKEFLVLTTLFHTNNKFSNSKFIYEGVRHLSILKAIKELSNSVKLIYLDFDFDTRYSRFLNRAKLTDSPKNKEHFIVRSKHPVEAEIRLLKLSSDYITSEKDIEKLMMNVTKYINSSY